MCLWSLGMLTGCWLIPDEVIHRSSRWLRFQLGHFGSHPHGLSTGVASVGSSPGNWVPRGRMQKSLEVLAQKVHNVILLLSVGQITSQRWPRFQKSWEIDGTSWWEQEQRGVCAGMGGICRYIFSAFYILCGSLSWARWSEAGIHPSFCSCPFHALSSPGQVLPLRGVAYSCPAAVTVAKCNSERKE